MSPKNLDYCFVTFGPLNTRLMFQWEKKYFLCPNEIESKRKRVIFSISMKCCENITKSTEKVNWVDDKKELKCVG